MNINNMIEQLREYFENTPREKVLEDWGKSAHLDNVVPTMDEFMDNTYENFIKQEASIYAEDWEEINQLDWETMVPIEVSKIDFITGAKSDSAKAYWYNQFLKERGEI
jgi:hypothetical protein